MSTVVHDTASVVSFTPIYGYLVTVTDTATGQRWNEPVLGMAVVGAGPWADRLDGTDGEPVVMTCQRLEPVVIDPDDGRPVTASDYADNRVGVTWRMTRSAGAL